jgi:hypothetical protein
MVVSEWFNSQQNTQRRSPMKPENESEERRREQTEEEPDGVLMHLETTDKEMAMNFKNHIEWWTILASDLGKTLVLEARLK